jgi:glucan phosphoethanolaminetransferase (alkaline phosphatase superfamily)
MALAAEGNDRVPVNAGHSGSAFQSRSPGRIFAVASALLLIASAANCFLKYLWWTACYSAWSGIPKLAEQRKAAAVHASFNGWCFLALEAASIFILLVVIRLRSAKISGFFNAGVRLVTSLVITVGGTAGCALIISWLKQSVQ